MAAVPTSCFLRFSRRLMNCSSYLSCNAAIPYGCQKYNVYTRATLVQARLKSTATTEGTAFTQANKNHSDTELTFEWKQLQTAYESKRIEELLRAIFVLKLCSYDTFVVNCMKVSVLGVLHFTVA